MTANKVNRKYFVWIWLALVLACFMRNAFNIYASIVSIEEPSRLAIFIEVIRIIFSYGAIPAVVTFVCALVVWQIGFSRYVRCISRNDFCYIVMAFTAAVRFLVGIIEIFSILDQNVYAFTTSVLDFALLTAAMLIMFFCVFSRNYHFNPVEKYNAFKLWSIIYMVVAGLLVFVENIAIALLFDGSALSNEILSLLNSLGYYFMASKVQYAASITAIVVYVAYLIAVIVLGELMRKDADKFRNPETRGEYFATHDNRAYNMRTDVDSTFAGYDNSDTQTKKEEEHVFDEFDL